MMNAPHQSMGRVKMSRTITEAEITYRATASWGEAEVRLRMDPSCATVADAWRRLSTRYAGLDPRTVEIEVRYARSAPTAALHTARGVGAPRLALV
jgi:hypothetical protein